MKIFMAMLTCSLSLHTCLASDDFTIFLVKHAEVTTENKNPGLTYCGKQRSKKLATLLSKVKVKSIYSTSDQKAMSTAANLSNQENITIKNYTHTRLEQLSLHVRQRNENALIIGDNLTTVQLTQHLSNTLLKKSDVASYHMLYQVHFVKGQAFLTQLTQSHRCH